MNFIYFTFLALSVFAEAKHDKKEKKEEKKAEEKKK